MPGALSISSASSRNTMWQHSTKSRLISPGLDQCRSLCSSSLGLLRATSQMLGISVRLLLPTSHVRLWDLYSLSIHSVLSAIPGMRPVLWPRERISALFLYMFAEHILYDKEKFRHSHRSCWQRYWWHGVPSYGRTASSTDRIPLDHESLGVCSTGSLVFCCIGLKSRLPPRKTGALVDWASFKELPYLLFAIGMFFVSFLFRSKAPHAYGKNGPSGASTLPFTILEPLHRILFTSHTPSPPTSS